MTRSSCTYVLQTPFHFKRVSFLTHIAEWQDRPLRTSYRRPFTLKSLISDTYCRMTRSSCTYVLQTPFHFKNVSFLNHTAEWQDRPVHASYNLQTPLHFKKVPFLTHNYCRMTRSFSRASYSTRSFSLKKKKEKKKGCSFLPPTAEHVLTRPPTASEVTTPTP